MANKMRKTGIGVLGNVPWGTHFCQFYKNQRDLLDILVPYFKTGLETNEFCMWVCSEPLGVEDAKKALGKAMPNLGAYLKKGQIEIIAHTEWYLRRGRFSSKRVLKGWIDKLDKALAKGFDGLRLTGNTFWLEKKDWRRFADYEEDVNHVISRYPMIALCTYSLDRCGVQEVIDVINSHRSTLIRRDGKWTLVQSSINRMVEEDLQRSEKRFQEVFEKSPIGIELYDSAGKLIAVNRSSLKIFGLTDPADVEGFDLFKDPNISPEVLGKLKKGMAIRYEATFDFEKVKEKKLYQTKRSGEIDLDVQITPLSIKGEKRGGYLVHVMDISKRKIIEKALKAAYAEVGKRVRERTAELARSNAQLRKEACERQRTEKELFEISRILDAFFASSLNPMVILDENFNFIRVNEAYAKACGRDVSEFAGHNHFEFYPHQENEAIFRNVVQTKEPFQAMAKPFIFPGHPEWGITYWDWNLSPILDVSGKTEFLVFSLKDVTERTLALEQLQQNEELLRNVMETLPVGVWIVDKTGQIIQGNRAGHEIWAGGTYVGIKQYGEYKGWWANTGKRIEPQEWAAARAVTKGEVSLNEEVEIECFDGTHKTIFNSAVPIRDKKNKITGAIILNQDITNRRRAETVQREQASLLELAHDAIIVRNIDGTIRFWNRGAEQMYGWSDNEVLGKVIHTLLQTVFPEPLDKINDKFVRNGRWEGELIHTNRFGVSLTVASRWAPQFDAKGQPAGILEINNDVSERKKAEEAVKISSLYTRSLIESSLDPLVTISPEGKITDVNKATELVTGVSREDLIGSDFSNYFTEPLKAREGYQQVFLNGAVRDYPLAIRHISGKVTDVLYNATIYENEAGEVQGVFAAARDITERKKAEEERLRLAKALEQAAEGILIMDTDREVLYVNPAFEQINDLRSGDILRSNYDDILRMVGKEEGLEQRIAETLSRGERWNGHMTRRKKDGSSCELDVVISPVWDESGNLRNYVSVERDVTEEVKLQNHIRQRQKMEALGTLAGGIAHDFNNILMPILINTEMALMEGSEGSAASRHLHLVAEAANRGKELVKQIIAFSRQKDQERSAIEISSVIREALKLLRASIPKNIEIVDHINAESAVVLADATQIHQVLMNLCSNASYAMREKGGILEVNLSEIKVDPNLASRHLDLKPGPYLRLTVSDTGGGMTPEVMEKIFDPFFTTKAPGEGTGMGLAVVHGIVKSHGGAITVYSEAGKGTTFNVLFPQIMGVPESKTDALGHMPTGKERILYLDDEDIQVRSVLPMLERLGYRVVGQTDAQKALAMFRKRPEAFDLVITDMTMPSMTGEKLAEKLLRLRPDIPIILCTGFSEAIHDEKAKSMGIRGFLMKPFSVREIAETIRRVLDMKA